MKLSASTNETARRALAAAVPRPACWVVVDQEPRWRFVLRELADRFGQPVDVRLIDPAMSETERAFEKSLLSTRPRVIAWRVSATLPTRLISAMHRVQIAMPSTVQITVGDPMPTKLAIALTAFGSILHTEHPEQLWAVRRLLWPREAAIAIDNEAGFATRTAT